MQTQSRIFTTLVLVGLLFASPSRGQTLDEARELHAAGDIETALEIYRAVAEKAGDDDPASAATALNNSCVILNGLGRFAAARAACEQAVRLRRMTNDNRRLARTLNNHALALQNLGEYDTARAIYMEALEINTEREDVPSQVLNLANLGTLATVAGDYGRALEFHERAAALARQHADEPWASRQLRISTANRGVVLERLGAYRQALDLYRGLIDADADGTDTRLRAQLKLNTGVIYRNLGDPVRAVEEFEAVANLFRKLDDADGLSNALLNLALAYHLNLDDPRRAEAAYREALELASRHGDRPEEIQDLFYLGQFLLEQDRLDEAEEMLRRCLAASDESGSREGRWSALAGLGRIAIERADPALAIEHFEQASDEIELVSADLEESTLLSGYFGDKRPVFSAAIRALVDLERREPRQGHAAQALEIAQRAKARALLDALGAEEWRAEPLTAGELRQAAGDGLIVEYFATEDALLRWSIRRDSILLDNLGAVEPVRRKIDLAHQLLADGSVPPAALLDELSALFPYPLDLPAGSTVFLALDGPLHRLPFSLLPHAGPGTSPIVEHLAVSYLPSASALSWLRERDRRQPLPRRESLGLRALGSPDIAKLLEEPNSPAGLFVTNYGLRPLPAVERELGALTRHLPGRAEVLAGPAATETAFRSDGGATRVLHIASHAVVDERPGRPAAILLGPDEQNDGLLEPREIATLDQRAALTVLSACQTAIGEPDGAAFATLAGSFLASGSSAVLATLWDIPDEAAAAFMEQFYYQLGQGVGAAAALQKAQTRLRQNQAWSSPYLWAGFVLVGEAPPVVVPASPFFRLAVIALVLALSVMTLLGVRRAFSTAG